LKNGVAECVASEVNGKNLVNVVWECPLSSCYVLAYIRGRGSENYNFCLILFRPVVVVEFSNGGYKIRKIFA
jgi:hypothetical protein